MLLYTGKEIHIDDWVELPIDKYAVKRVEEMAKIENPTFDQYPIFEWAPETPIMVQKFVVVNKSVWRRRQYVSTSVSYPETKKLLEVREYVEQLIENKGELFRSVVKNLLFIMKVSRPDLETDASFFDKYSIK